MLFVAFLKIRPDAPPMAESVARRAQYQPPARTRLIAEYWLQSNDPTTIVILEADGVAPLMAIRAVWADVFDITFVPAMTLEEGMAAVRLWHHSKDTRTPSGFGRKSHRLRRRFQKPDGPKASVS